MPLQSRRSLNAARPLTASATQNIASQNQPVPQSHCQRASTAGSAVGRWRLRGELQNRLALTDHPHLLARDLLDVRGVVPEPRGELFELLLLLAEPHDVTLGRRDLALHLPERERVP